MSSARARSLPPDPFAQMDSELWASLLSSTKRRLASHSDRPLSYDDLEGDDDTLFEFSCPFCYMEFDIGSLCSHLEEEHCFESKSVVCPVCAAKAGNDVVGHITHQHGHLFKMQRRRRVRKASMPSTSSCTPFSLDPLLSSLLCDLPIPETVTASKLIAASEEASLKNPLSNDQNATSCESPLDAEKCEQKLGEAALRAKFVQQMVLSTIFRDD